MTAHLAYYEVLGLDAPPEDRKAVKRAYSKKLKVTRPEDDPDGFMRLRDAHDLALKILARRPEETAQDVPTLTVQTTYVPEVEPEIVPPPEPQLTYEDMLPLQNTKPKPEPKSEPMPEPLSETTYTIGPTPNFHAPVNLQEPQESQTQALIKDLNAILADQKFYHDREQWNSLFRKARQLDIDDYVDFEQLLLDAILQFHGYYDDDQENYQLGALAPKFSPSITASLFKTMSWDQMSPQGYHQSHKIEWLERRMNVRKQQSNPVPVSQPNTMSTRKLWFIIIGAFILTQFLFALANS